MRLLKLLISFLKRAILLIINLELSPTYFLMVLYDSAHHTFSPKSLTLPDMKKNIPLEEGDYYLSEEGYKVFTEQYHLKRGYCCESNCRHCPYGYDGRIN